MVIIKNSENGNNKGKNKSNRDKKSSQKDIALSRIAYLFDQARNVFDGEKNQVLANRYVGLARKMALRYKVSFSKEQKLTFCKKCGFFLSSSVNSRTRVNKHRIIVLCNNCKTIKRLNFK